MSHLLEFYGQECPHCIRMHELVDKLEKEESVKVERIEVWHNQKNEEKLLELDKGDMCGGVPFFYNEKNKNWLCGEVSYKELKEWALS